MVGVSYIVSRGEGALTNVRAPDVAGVQRATPLAVGDITARGPGRASPGRGPRNEEVSDTRTAVRGSTLAGTCDRGGFTELFTPEGRSIILPTTCKTWGCVVCRKKLLALFKARVEVGVSHLGPCSFITTTYLAGSVRLRDAECVAKDWQGLWRRLRRSGLNVAWLKVTEKTKAGTPHHHILIGPVEGKIRCHGKTIARGRETANYLRALPLCVCLSHQFARAWLATTGDSFMCFATPVWGPIGAAAYMAKYLVKAFLLPQRKDRRFSTSRNWPGGRRIRLQVTIDKGWSHIRRWPAHSFSTMYDLNEHQADLLQRNGDDITFKIARRQSKKAATIAFRKVLGNDDSSQR